MTRDIDMSAADLDPCESVTDSFKDKIDDVAMRTDQLDLDSARQQLHLLTMIGRTQMTIINDKDVKIEELRDQVYDLDNDATELRDKLKTAEVDLEKCKERYEVIRDSWYRSQDDFDRVNNGLHTSVKIMVVMAVFMLVELLAIAWLALA